MMHVLPVNVADKGMCCSDVDKGSCAAIVAACVDSTKPCGVPAAPVGNMLVARERMGQEAALFHAYLFDSDHVEVLAAASEASESSYARKTTTDGKPWPKEQNVREMK